MRARLLPLCLLSASACASTRSVQPVQPVTFGSPELFGPGITSTTENGDVTLSLNDSAHVILLRVYPMAGIDAYLPGATDTGTVAPGTHRVAARSRERSEWVTPPAAPEKSGPTLLDQARCVEAHVGWARLSEPYHMARVYGNVPDSMAASRSTTVLRPVAANYASHCLFSPASPSPRSAHLSVVVRRDEGYLLLIASDVATDPVRLREAVTFVAVPPDSIGAALPQLAERLVGTRTRNWAAYALAPRP